MNKYIKVLSLLLALTGSAYLPSAYAANSTNEMLITIAETNPVLIDRLNEIALDDEKLLNQLLEMSDSKASQLERLLDIAEYSPELFAKLVTIKSAQTSTSSKSVLSEQNQQVTTFGAISDGGGIIQN